MREQDTPRTLRLLHLSVFLGLAGFTVRAGETEWRQFARGLTRPFHSGAPPAWWLLGAGAVACGGACTLLICALTRRSARLEVSVAMVLGFLVSLAGPLGRPVRELEERAPDVANLRILATAGRLQQSMAVELQTRGEVPLAAEGWQQRFDGWEGEALSPVRTRGFSRVGLRVVKVEQEGLLPPSLEPGVLVLFVSKDAARFSLTPVGFGPGGEAAPLVDARGTRLVLRGVFH